MKRWLFCAAAMVLAAALGLTPFAGSDVATLQPVELIWVGVSGDALVVRTDTGDSGRGNTVEQAFANLKQTTPGEVFLDTVDYLLLQPSALKFLPALTDILRPACNVCLVEQEVDLEKAAGYLRVHSENYTLQNYRTGKGNIPYLKADEERLKLVSKES